MFERIGIGCLAMLLAGLAAPARADLTISNVPEQAMIAPGGTDTIDVYLTHTANTPTDMIDNLGFTLQITGPGFLEFAGLQDFGYLNAGPTPGPQYVFYGDSFDYQSSSAGGSVTSNPFPNDTFIGSDSTFSGDPVTISSGQSFLLAVLTVDAVTTSNGDSYTISLTPSSGSGSNGGNPPSYFDNYDFNGGTGEISSAAFSSTNGTVNIGLAAVIPEPTSMITSLTGAALLATFGWLRARRSKRQPAGKLPAGERVSARLVFTGPIAPP